MKHRQVKTSTADCYLNVVVCLFVHCLFLQTELAAQKEALDKEHCRALENLKKQVLNTHLYCYYCPISQKPKIECLIIRTLIIMFRQSRRM